MKATYPLILAAASLLMNSCGGAGTAPGSRTYTFDDFTTVDLTDAAQEITSDPDVIGLVKGLCVLNDSVLAISLGSSDINVLLYNLRSGEHQVANRRGNGPQEITYVYSISATPDGAVLMAGIKDRKLLTARWNPDGGPDALIDALPAPDEDYMRVIAAGPGRMLALSTPPRRSRLVIIGSDGAAADSLAGLFPATEMPQTDMPSFPTNYLFQAEVACNDGMAVVVNKQWNEIEIVPLDGSAPTRLIGPEHPELAVARFGNEVVQTIGISPQWFMFGDVTASDSLIHVGYIGAEVKSKADFERQTGSVLEFDSQGRPLRRLMLPAEAWAFAVDYRSGTLYTVEERPELTLVKYQLK